MRQEGSSGRRAAANTFRGGMARLFFLALITAGSLLLGAGTLDLRAEERTAPAVIRYEELEALVKEYSPQVEMERAQYDSRLARYENAREEIMDTRRLLREEADSMEKEGDTAGAESYRAQAKNLEEAAKDMDKRIRSAKSSSSSMSLRQMEDTMTWAAQSLVGTYHSLKLEAAAATAQAELKESLYQKAQRQLANGGISQRETQEADQAARDAAVRAGTLTDEMTRVKGQLAMLIGYESGEAIEIASMPEPDSGRSEGIMLETDKWRALGNNYELRAQRGSSSRGTNRERHARQRSMEQSEGNMYAQVETLYQDVMANRTAWNGAVTAMAAADAKWQADSHKMELGMLSDQEYLEAKAAYLEALAAKGQADVNFQQAMDAYHWAVKGLIQ